MIVRDNVPNELRRAVFERDNYTCQYCGRSCEEAELEIEHIIPVSKGGNNDIRNLATACRACNRSKGARILTTGELQQIADKINTSLEYLMSLASENPNNEKKTEKIMLYLTPELITQIRTWCDLKGISANSYITALIETDLESKAEKINTFLELRKGL